MNNKLILLIVICFFEITFIGPAAAYEEIPNTDEYGNDIVSDDPCFNLPNGQMLIEDSLYEPEIGFTLSINRYDDTLTGLSSFKGLKKLANYIYYHFDWKRGAATTADGVINTGYGDCWGLTDFSKMILDTNNYTVKVQQLKTKESNNHRRLLVLLNNRWVKFDPSLCTEHYGFKPYKVI